ncbi:MAG: glutamate racemase [Pseudomonadota bacterium]
MIGIFDSGLGGLSVLKTISQTLANERLLYLADNAHIPYGDKTEEFIKQRVLSIGEYLVQQGCTILVVACNTATAAAINALRSAHPKIPIVGVEPGVKPAASASRSGRIAILATPSTARSTRLAELIARYAAGVHVDIQPCPGWATRVETLQLDDPTFAAEANARLTPLIAAGADHIVLGCTHYSFLIPLLSTIIDGRAQLVDVASAVARQCSRLLDASVSNQQGIRQIGKIKLFATADPGRLERALSALHLGEDVLNKLEGEASLAKV